MKFVLDNEPGYSFVEIVQQKKSYDVAKRKKRQNLLILSLLYP